MNIHQILQKVKNQVVIEQSTVKKLCRKMQQLLVEESNLLQLSYPINIVGDVHGQFYDVLQIFEIGGQVPDSNYLFIGDFVDRGYNSVETIMYLFCLKLLYPKNIFLTRGNHQSRQISCMYGFHEQINRKYGNTNVWKYFNETFDYLPLAAVISNEIFCVHGGLSPQIHAMDQIREIDRCIEMPTEGPFADLMWSDPQEIESWAHGQRGAGWLFGYRVVNEFNHHNGLTLIARAHQLAQEGYVEWFENKNLATVWSAPNYCYRCNNLASILKVDEYGKREFKIFKEAERSRQSKHYREIIPYFL